MTRSVDIQILPFVSQYLSLSLSLSLRFAQQWWDAKRNHYDCVIFFRKGYFYELFNHDADIGGALLNLKGTVMKEKERNKERRERGRRE
jgi:hypothetical protein